MWIAAGVLFLVGAVASLIGGNEVVAALLAVAGVMMFIMPGYQARNVKNRP